MHNNRKLRNVTLLVAELRFVCQRKLKNLLRSSIFLYILLSIFIERQSHSHVALVPFNLVPVLEELEDFGK